MAEINIFVRSDCPQCPQAKVYGNKLEEEGLVVNYCDLDTPTGFAKAVKLKVKSLPTILIINEDGEEVNRWGAINMPGVEEIKNILR
jgi:glutaredoxin